MDWFNVAIFLGYFVFSGIVGYIMYEINDEETIGIISGMIWPLVLPVLIGIGIVVGVKKVVCQLISKG